MTVFVYMLCTYAVGFGLWFMISIIMDGLRYIMMLNHIRLPAPGLKWELIKLTIYAVIAIPLYMTMASSL